MRRLARAIAGTIAYVISTKISLSWLKFHSNQDSPKTGDHSYVGPSPSQYGPPCLKEARSRLLVNLVPMLEQKKKKKKKKNVKYNINIRVAGEVV